ncbi:MAG: TetR/AcrR family transcriptional repressor of nem operon [Gammaproteobacteria bacterium]|jgi:TetR/AcrR family transcriptional repressor of nem operon
MVRTKEFDEENVIAQAAKAFLKDSYSSTSISALELATGVGRKSLYNTFGSKHDLLLRALEKFAFKSTESFIEPLERPGAGRKEIEHVVNAMVSQMTSKSGQHGCLLCISAQDSIGSSKPVESLVASYFARARAGFLKCIKAGIKEGDITTSTPAQNLADYFVGVLMGISTMARTGAARKTIKNYSDVALRSLE